VVRNKGPLTDVLSIMNLIRSYRPTLKTLQLLGVVAVVMVFCFAAIVEFHLDICNESCETECEEHCDDDCSKDCGCVSCFPTTSAVQAAVPSSHYLAGPPTMVVPAKIISNEDDWVNSIDHPPQWDS
jgi:hypothetical protein